jgi:hypothetical protein
VKAREELAIRQMEEQKEMKRWHVINNTSEQSSVSRFMELTQVL